MTRIGSPTFPTSMECGGRASPTSADTALASASGSIWSAVAERVWRAPTLLWLRRPDLYGVRWQSESGERRHRFGFGNFDLRSPNFELRTLGHHESHD